MTISPTLSIIADGVAPKPNEYGVLFFHYTKQDYSGILLPPWSHKIEGVNVYRFYLPELVIIVQVDQRSIPIATSKILLQEQPSNYIGFLSNISGSERRYTDEMKKQLRSNLEGK
jgi:hypothetical protein